jgi:hypothetical protein
MPQYKTNLNVLAWYTALEYQNHRKSYIYDKVFPFCVAQGFIPPFQLVGESVGTINEFVIINFNDGSETDVTSQLTANGFNVQSFTDYDLIIYPAVNAFSGSWAVGRYYCRMTDGSQTWYSDVFNMSDAVDLCLKLEWFHLENVVYNGGHIQYNYPYKSYCYIEADIGKPEFKTLEEIDTRDGKDFHLKITTWKEYKFKFIAPEYMVDAIHRTGQHDKIFIYKNNLTYNVEKFNVDVTEWLANGAIAEVEATFRIDSFVTVSARAYTSLEYTAAVCGCLTEETIKAVATIDQTSAEYLGYYYLDTDGVTQIPLEPDDYILKINLDGRYILEQFNGSGYDGYDPGGNGFPAVCVLRDQEYFFESGFFYQQTAITNITDNGGENYTVSGETFDGLTVEIWGRDGTGNYIFYGSGSSAEFNGSGITLDAPGAVTLQARPKTVSCSDFDNSTPVAVGAGGGIGVMIINSTFIVA